MTSARIYRMSVAHRKIQDIIYRAKQHNQQSLAAFLHLEGEYILEYITSMANVHPLAIAICGHDDEAFLMPVQVCDD